MSYSSSVIKTDLLQQLIHKLEKLDEEKHEVLESIKEVCNEAKLQGFDVKILKQVLKLRKKDKNKLAEEEALLDMYRQALGL